jgi:hypothetical protein
VIEYLIADLCRQRMYSDHAWDLVARMDIDRGELIDDPDDKAVEKLSGRLKRSRTK